MLRMFSLLLITSIHYVRWNSSRGETFFLYFCCLMSFENENQSTSQIQTNDVAELPTQPLIPVWVNYNHRLLDLEEAVLGALMLEKDALSSVIDVLKAEVFYR
jgi:replicative DNA helicase